MAWKRDRLADIAVRSIKPADHLRKLSNGKGLQLWITPKGGRYWRLEYRCSEAAASQVFVWNFYGTTAQAISVRHRRLAPTSLFLSAHSQRIDETVVCTDA
jgi:hypothetical protein